MIELLAIAACRRAASCVLRIAIGRGRDDGRSRGAVWAGSRGALFAVAGSVSGRVSVRVYYVRLYVRMAFSETQTTLRTAPHNRPHITHLRAPSSFREERPPIFHGLYPCPCCGCPGARAQGAARSMTAMPGLIVPERNVEPCSSAEASHETTWTTPTPSVRAPCAGSSACADDGGDVWASRDVLKRETMFLTFVTDTYGTLYK